MQLKSERRRFTICNPDRKLVDRIASSRGPSRNVFAEQSVCVCVCVCLCVSQLVGRWICGRAATILDGGWRRHGGICHRRFPDTHRFLIGLLLVRGVVSTWLSTWPSFFFNQFLFLDPERYRNFTCIPFLVFNFFSKTFQWGNLGIRLRIIFLLNGLMRN